MKCHSKQLPLAAVVALLWSASAGYAQLKIDFSQTGTPVESGYLGYLADHEIAATFTSQSFSAFGTTITITPTWAAGAAAAAMQMIDRGGDDGFERPDLLRDWIGTDTRQTGNPLTLTLSGLPAGLYSWLSYHADGQDQTGLFDVTVNDASGSTTTTGVDISDTNAGLNTEDEITKFITEIVSNGTDDVTLVFDCTSGGGAVNVAFFVMNGFELELISDPDAANFPLPSSGSEDVLKASVLSWTASQEAVAHDVYLGTSSQDVTEASREDPLGVLVSTEQSASSYAHPTNFVYGQTYYWRVDEVRGAPDFDIYRGETWSFTVEPFSLVLENLNVTASSFHLPTVTPQNTINGSGLNALDQHSVDSGHMWLSSLTDTERWIQYEFDRPYELDQMWVWNQNSAVEPFVGFGIRSAVIATSMDGEDWTPFTETELAQGTGSADYQHNTTIDFNGQIARYVRVTSLSDWGSPTGQVGLSEVRLFYVPTYAREPQPANGVTTEGTDIVLNWRLGRDSTGSDVYLGTDSNNLSLAGTVTQNSFDLSGSDPQLEETYYWQVHEMENGTVWPGSTWSFSTPAALTVDDFDDYTSEDPSDPEAIFNVWLDGFDNNGNSSLVGYDLAPFAETTTVLSGLSMPFFYGEGPGSVAEATRTFDGAQDWTRGGVETLVLYFHGDAGNAPGSLYIKINNTTITYNSANATQSPLWKQWTIDLAGVSGLTQVRSLTIGVGSSGAGTLFVDDVLLYRSAPAVIEPIDPGTQGLVALYTMENTVQDSSGSGYDGTQVDGTFFVEGNAGLGTALQFSGLLDHVDLPIGPLVATLTNTTVATWVDFDGSTAASWQRIFDFGSGTTSYMFLSPRTGTTGPMRFAITTGGNAAESFIQSSGTLPGGWHHVAVTTNAADMTMQLYLDGQVEAEGPTTVLPSALGNTTQNWLGRSQFTGDGYFLGSLDNFSIYNRVLSEGEIRYLVGDR